MSSVHRFSWMILNAGGRFALFSRRPSSIEHINCLSPTAAGLFPARGAKGAGLLRRQFLLPWADGTELLRNRS